MPRALARPLDGADGAARGGAETWMCANVASLRILGAPLVGSAVPEARLARHAASGFAQNIDPGYVVSSVEDLYVRDCGPLAPEDRQWFSENVAAVRWNSWRDAHGQWLSD